MHDFANRKNYTIVYYTMNLASTEEVNLFQSESNFAVGVTCDANKKEKLSFEEGVDSYIIKETAIPDQYKLYRLIYNRFIK